MKKYVNPEIEVLEIDIDDVITASIVEGEDEEYDNGEGGTPGMPM